MANFGNCINWVLRLEDRTLRGDTVDLKDGAGYTRFGITQKNCPQVPENFWIDTTGAPRMTNDEALEAAQQVYHDRYWTPLQGAAFASDELAATLLSFAVNDGVSDAVKLLQGCLGFAQAARDGKLGPATLQAALMVPSTILIAELQDAQETRYQAIEAAHPGDVKFDAGWRKRAYAHYPDLP